MTPALIVAVAVTGTALGIAIGAVGIGGVLLVPFLTLTLGIDIRHAIAAALLSYIPSCAAAVTLYARHGSIPWREAGLLCISALPTAYLGARMTQHAPAAILEAAIGILLLTGGAYALLPLRDTITGQQRLPSLTLVGLGGGTGFLSAMTGAGGAVVLLPILLLLDVPVLPAIGLGQAIALPIAGLASLANIAAGMMDVWLATALAATLTLGIAIGTPIAHALPQSLLRRLLGSAVVLAGLAMLVRTFAHLVSAD
jgi:uncharacterized membrane protein YfcA